MFTHVRFSTDPPKGDTATIPSRPLSEMIVANLFNEAYQFCITRLDDDEDDNPLFVAPQLTHEFTSDGDKEIMPPLYGGALPDAYVFYKICKFIAELTANSDEFTQIRCGSFNFANNVLEFLRRDPRLAYSKMRPAHDDYVFERVDKVVETRRANRQRMLA